MTYFHVSISLPGFRQAHGGSLQGCEIRPCTDDSPHSSLSPGFGVFRTSTSDGMSSVDQTTAVTDLEAPAVLSHDDALGVPLAPPAREGMKSEPARDFPANEPAVWSSANSRENLQHATQCGTHQKEQMDHDVDPFHGETVLMAVPLSLVISKHTAARCPLFGRHLSAMIDADVIDDRTAVLLFLALHRALGQDSPYHR